MATMTFLRDIPNGIEMRSSSIYDGFEMMDVLSASATRLRVQDPAYDDIFTYAGTGLTYNQSTGYVTGGTVASVTATYLGQTFFSWTGLNVSAANLFTYVRTDKWTALNKLLFNTSDTYNLTDGNDDVNGFGGNDVMRGFGGDDVLTGDNGKDRLFGGIGKDVLFGSAGADRLDGGAGADTLVGGSEIDRLTGGGGADVFAFTFNGATHHDIVTDFNAKEDLLYMHKTAFSAFGYSGQLRAGSFVAGTTALDAGDRFIYQKSTGNLWYDRDGSGAAAKVLVAELADGTTLTAADIFVI